MGNICNRICNLRKVFKREIPVVTIVDDHYKISFSLSRSIIDLNSDIIKKTDTGFRSLNLELLLFHSNDNYTVLHNKEKNKITVISKSKNDKIILVLNIPKIVEKLGELFYDVDDVIIIANDMILFEQDFLMNYEGNQNLKLYKIEAKDRIYFHFSSTKN